MLQLRLAGVVRESVVDGPGIRLVFFTQGCPHRCPGCHNPETQALEGGFWAPVDGLAEQVKRIPLLTGVTFSGGEPFLQAEALAVLGETLKAHGLSVVTYTGYTFEQLLTTSRGDPSIKRLLDVTDFLIDGPFLQAERDLSLAFRGSKNQRIIDVRRSMQSGQPVLAAV